MTAPHIRASRVGALLRLVGEASELPVPFRRQHVLDGTGRLLGASSTVMIHAEDFLPNRKSRIVEAVSSGWTDACQRRYLSAIVAGSCNDPTVPLFVALPGQRTRRRQDLLSDRQWYSAPWVAEDLRAASLDHAIYSARPKGAPGAVEGIAVYRAWGDRSFTEEDRELLHLLHTHGAWLWRDDSTPKLTEALRVLPRHQRDTLVWLCRGASEKEIAAELGISPHTVHGYVKALHRYFGVSSRSELLAHCLGGARS